MSTDLSSVQPILVVLLWVFLLELSFTLLLVLQGATILSYRPSELLPSLWQLFFMLFLLETFILKILMQVGCYIWIFASSVLMLF